MIRGTILVLKFLKNKNNTEKMTVFNAYKTAKTTKNQCETPFHYRVRVDVINPGTSMNTGNPGLIFV